MSAESRTWFLSSLNSTLPRPTTKSSDIPRRRRCLRSLFHVKGVPREGAHQKTYLDPFPFRTPLNNFPPAQQRSTVLRPTLFRLLNCQNSRLRRLSAVKSLGPHSPSRRTSFDLFSKPPSAVLLLTEERSGRVCCCPFLSFSLFLTLAHFHNLHNFFISNLYSTFLPPFPFPSILTSTLDLAMLQTPSFAAIALLGASIASALPLAARGAESGKLDDDPNWKCTSSFPCLLPAAWTAADICIPPDVDCYSNVPDPILDNAISYTNNVARCLSLAASQGYDFAGVTEGRICYVRLLFVVNPWLF